MEIWYLTREFNGCPVGTQIRVYERNDTSVQISINGELEWISLDTFKHITEHVPINYWFGPSDNRKDGFNEFDWKGDNHYENN